MSSLKKSYIYNMNTTCVVRTCSLVINVVDIFIALTSSHREWNFLISYIKRTIKTKHDLCLTVLLMVILLDYDLCSLRHLTNVKTDSILISIKNENSKRNTPDRELCFFWSIFSLLRYYVWEHMDVWSWVIYCQTYNGIRFCFFITTLMNIYGPRSGIIYR